MWHAPESRQAYSYTDVYFRLGWISLFMATKTWNIHDRLTDMLMRGAETGLVDQKYLMMDCGLLCRLDCVCSRRG